MSDNKGKQAEEGKKKGKGLLIGILTVVLAGGAGAGWFFLKPPADPEAEQQALHAPSKEPIFVNLEPFTVNLADEGGERMAQVTVVLQMLNKQAEDNLKKLMPAVRNQLLMLISSHKAADLLSKKGKENLADEIAEHTATVLGWEKPAVSGRYQVESYLDYHAGKLLARFDANTYLIVTHSMMVHDVGTGRGGIEAALSTVTARTLVVDVDSDRLFLPAQADEMERGIAGARRQTIASLHGHDGFLIESEQMEAILRDFLAGA